MNPFTYVRALDSAQAVVLGSRPGAKYLGGGTNLVDLMRETVERPQAVGKIGITGTAAAIANAVFNATGWRVRTLPITLDKLL